MTKITKITEKIGLNSIITGYKGDIPKWIGLYGITWYNIPEKYNPNKFTGMISLSEIFETGSEMMRKIKEYAESQSFKKVEEIEIID